MLIVLQLVKLVLMMKININYFPLIYNIYLYAKFIIVNDLILVLFICLFNFPFFKESINNYIVIMN